MDTGTKLKELSMTKAKEIAFNYNSKSKVNMNESTLK